MNITIGNEDRINPCYRTCWQISARQDVNTAYFERVELFFEINGIAAEKQITWFLSMMGADILFSENISGAR